MRDTEKTFSAKSFAAGLLLGRAVPLAARLSGWDMAVIAGADAGSVLGAAIFALGCALAVIAGYDDDRAASAISLIACALYALSRAASCRMMHPLAALPDCVIISLAAGGMPAAALSSALCLIPLPPVAAEIKITAVVGNLAAALLAGRGILHLRGAIDIRRSIALLAGMAAAILIK